MMPAFEAETFCMTFKRPSVAKLCDQLPYENSIKVAHMLLMSRFFMQISSSLPRRLIFLSWKFYLSLSSFAGYIQNQILQDGFRTYWQVTTKMRPEKSAIMHKWWLALAACAVAAPISGLDQSSRIPRNSGTNIQSHRSYLRECKERKK